MLCLGAGGGKGEGKPPTPLPQPMKRTRDAVIEELVTSAVNSGTIGTLKNFGDAHLKALPSWLKLSIYKEKNFGSQLRKLAYYDPVGDEHKSHFDNLLRQWPPPETPARECIICRGVPSNPQCEDDIYCGYHTDMRWESFSDMGKSAQEYSKDVHRKIQLFAACKTQNKR